MKKTILFLVMLLLLGACGNEEFSPSDVTSNLFDYASENEFSKMEKYISSNLLTVFENNGYDMNSYANNITEEGRIESIEILNETIKGEGASVDYKALYSDGTEEKQTVDLIKENNVWKISAE